MFSVLYVYEPGRIEKLGSWPTEAEADAAAKEAQRDGVLRIEDQHVYLMRPDGELVEYSIKDLIPSIVQPVEE